MKERELIKKEEGVTDKLFNLRPVFFAAIFLCLGISFSYFYILYGVSKWWLLLLVPTAITPFIFVRTKERAIKTLICALAFFLFFLTGGAAFRAQLKKYADSTLLDGEYTVVGKVIDLTQTSYGVSLTLSEVIVDGKGRDGKLIAYLSTSFKGDCALSDEVVLVGAVTLSNEYFDEYGFKANAIGENIKFYMQAEDCIVTGSRFDPFLLLRSRVESVLVHGMDETPASVMLALLTGNTTNIEEGLFENIRRGGIAHVFAVSGLHVGALYAFCLFLTSKTKMKRLSKFTKFFFVAILLFLYGGVCGYSTSVVRAMVMCLAFYAAKLIGVGKDMHESIGLAGIVVLFISPVALFEIGFQLSFGACLGIALLARPFKTACNAVCSFLGGVFTTKESGKSLKEIGEEKPLSVLGRIKGRVISFLSVTLSAQTATAPILLNAFGYLSGWSLLLNCLFVPLVGAIFSTLLLFAVVASLLPIVCAKVILYVPSVCFSAVMLLFEAIDFSRFVIEGIFIPLGGILVYFAGLTFISDKWNISRKEKRILLFLCILAFLLTTYLANA